MADVPTPPPFLLPAEDRLVFERRLQRLRLGLLCGVPLTPIAFGPQALYISPLIGAGVLGSYALVAVLLRRNPERLLRWQLALRVLDCVLAALILTLVHGLAHNAYYDVAYLFFVVAGAATHGRRGALLLSAVAAAGVILGRGSLVATGALAPDLRHVSDSVFYLIYFGATGLTTVYLMERAGHVVALRERALQQEREAFLLTLSHDLRNPLTVLKGQIGSLQRRLDRQHALEEQALAERLARMAHATNRLVYQLDELLDQAGAAAGARAGEGKAPSPGPVDLVGVARRAVETYAAVSDAHQVSLEADGETLAGSWDAGLLERVLDNLLTNALKYSAGGQIVVRVQREPDGWARLSVQDNGQGIPAAELPHVFEPFWRGSQARGRAPGTGLGLASVRQIAEQHGGSASVDSTAGAGTTVTVRLPLEASPQLRS